jgi:nucleoside phosphorylase
MEKNDLLGVRTKPVTKPVSVKRRRKAAAGGGGGRRIAKAIADYLASDSYMYAPLVSDPQQQPPPTTPPPAPAPAAASPGELMIPHPNPFLRSRILSSILGEKKIVLRP